jgi:hypothetical protein
LLPSVVLLAEFVLAMAAVLLLLAYFAGAIKMLVVESFTNGNALKIEGVSASETSKCECTIMEKQK